MTHRSLDARVRNEVLKQRVNERVRDVNDALGQLSGVGEWLCECSRNDCVDRVTMSAAEYERVRAHSRRFAVRPDHVDDEIERVVEERGDHVIVEKTGEAAALAERHDPRP